LNAGEVKELPIASCNIRESKKSEIYMVYLPHKGSESQLRSDWWGKSVSLSGGHKPLAAAAACKVQKN